MAIFRKIHTTFWSDSFISELSNDQKLFYLYILTNERTKQCGIYEITKRQISFDLSCSIDTVSKHLKYFIERGKIMYNEKTSEVAIKNWFKFNDSTSPKVQSCVNKELKEVKDKVLIEYIYNTDTQTQEEQEQEEEEEEQEESKESKLSKRSLIFKSDVFSFDYPQTMLQAFFDYWTEPNKSKTKLKFEMQDTWETKRRLATWASRDKGYKTNTINPTTDRLCRFTSTMSGEGLPIKAPYSTYEMELRNFGKENVKFIEYAD